MIIKWQLCVSKIKKITRNVILFNMRAKTGTAGKKDARAVSSLSTHFDRDVEFMQS